MKKPVCVTLVVCAAVILSSCTKDLSVQPIDPNVNTLNNVFKDPSAYKRALAKVYASFAISGQTGGGGGSPDISGIDENFGNYLRQYWDLQELPTDEAIMAWDDATIKDFHWQTWSSNDVFVMALYSRIFYTVAISNEFIRNVDNGMGSVSGTQLTEMKAYKAEARFLRALAYWHAIDLFGNVPFVTETDLPGAFFPKRITRTQLFTYIESELKAIETDLVAAQGNEYARADRGAAWFLLAKLYLNAKVYTGTDRSADALTYINRVTTAGYTLDANYARVFGADNNTSSEIILPIAFDGQNTQQYGGMTFILHASNGGGIPLNGIDGGWGGIRTIKDLVSKFGIVESNFDTTTQYQAADKRGMFFFDRSSWTWNVTNVGTFTQGIGVTKFKNVTASGGAAPNAHATFVSTDFPMFRLADAYLMYAEAVVRGGGGSMTTAVGYINALRQRAYGDATGNVSAANVTLDFLLDERGRELYWEGHRRTDLIRFGQFTNGSYVWQWKGRVQSGIQTASYRDLYPIPINDLNANPNLVQNPGY